MKAIVTYIKTALLLLTKSVYIGIFAVISVLLLKMLYFPSDGDANNRKQPLIIEEYARNEEMINAIVNENATPVRNHFHITDEYVLHLESEPPVCLICHGIYPHNMNKKIISLLNLHVGFIACEICHIPKSADNTGRSFMWADLKTGKLSGSAEGKYGKYNAKIVPLTGTGDDTERQDRVMSDKFRTVYDKLKNQWYSQEERQAEVKRVHDENYAEKPVSCKDCHKKDGHLNYSKLGFSPKRTAQLISSEVTSMVEHYDVFYMPKMLRFK